MSNDLTYQYCGICGSTPSGAFPEMNIRSKWWDPDDGWKFGALCRHCKEEFGDVKPKEGDYAFEGACVYNDENILTDEDIIDLL